MLIDKLWKSKFTEHCSTVYGTELICHACNIFGWIRQTFNRIWNIYSVGFSFSMIITYKNENIWPLFSGLANHRRHVYWHSTSHANQDNYILGVVDSNKYIGDRWCWWWWCCCCWRWWWWWLLLLCINAQKYYLFILERV